MDQDETWHAGRPRRRQQCVRWGPSSPSRKRGRDPLPNFRPISIVAKRLDASSCHLVDGSQPRVPKMWWSPQFSALVYCGQTAGCIKMPLGTEVGLSPGDFVLDGDAAPLPKRGHSPHFSAHVYCGQTAAWITMALGTEVGLGPDDIVLDGDPAPSCRKRGWRLLPNLQPMSIVAKWLDGSRWH